MKNVIKFIYGLVKVLPLIGEILEIFTNRKETSNNTSNPRSDKDFIDNV